MAVRSAAEAPLPQHGEMQRAARLGKHGPGIVMGHIADIIVVDLKQQTNKQHSYDQCMTKSYFPNLQKCLHDVPKENQHGENARGSLTYKENHSIGFYSIEFKNELAA